LLEILKAGIAVHGIRKVSNLQRMTRKSKATVMKRISRGASVILTAVPRNQLMNVMKPMPQMNAERFLQREMASCVSNGETAQTQCDARDRVLLVSEHDYHDHES
jgi:hypothetical protein